MPRQSTLKHHRVQRHYYDLSARACFSPERLFAHPLSSARTKLPVIAAEAGLESDKAELLAGNSDPLHELKATITKPKGEVARPNRGGYTLKTALGWTDEKYDDLVVSRYV